MQKKKQTGGTIGGRIYWVLLFFFAAFGALLLRIFILQVTNHQEYMTLAGRQHQNAVEFTKDRGTIYAQDKGANRIALGINRTYKNLVASPKTLENPTSTAGHIAQEFNLSVDEVAKKLNKKDDPYEVLLKKVDEKKVEKTPVHLLEPGIFFEEEKGRTYPYGKLSAHILGFVSKEEEEEMGRYGIERFYEKNLNDGGEMEVAEEGGEENSSGFWATIGRHIIARPQRGSDVLLTVDYNIQVKAEEKLFHRFPD